MTATRISGILPTAGDHAALAVRIRLMRSQSHRLLPLLLLLGACVGEATPAGPVEWSQRAGGARSSGAATEAKLRDVLARAETEHGLSHPEVAAALYELANLYSDGDQGRYVEAVRLHERALAIREATFGPNHPDVARSLRALGMAYSSLGRYAEAGPLLRRALQIQEPALGRDDLEVAGYLDDLATVYLRQDWYAEAEPLQQQALAIRQKVLGAESPETAGSLNNIAAIRLLQGRDAETEALFKQALAIFEASLIPDHPYVGLVLLNLAFVLERQSRYPEAFEVAKSAVNIQIRRLATGPGSTRMSLAPDNTGPWATLVTIGSRLRQGATAERAAGLVDETFRAVQRLQNSDTTTATARVAARFSAGSDALAALIRERQDLAERQATLDRAIVAAVSRPPAGRDVARERELRRNLSEAGARLIQIDRKLTDHFPNYTQLANPEPAGVAEVQRELAPDEAMLVYMVRNGLAEGRYRHQPASFVWIIRHDRADMAAIDLRPDYLAGVAAPLRAQLDPSEWRDDHLSAFDARTAHRLYKRLFAFDPTLLSGIRHLLIVPDGALSGLPFSVLVRTPPQPNAPYREVDWLARSFATTTLPSVSSLRALRRFTKSSHAGEVFRGIGDPALNGPPGPARGVNVAQLLTRGLADPVQVRALPPLPETAGELKALARGLGAGEGSLYLRERATEGAVKAGALAGARVLAFATHAGVAGELPGLAEPALVLTPPATATEEDDGLLTASEAAKLKLDADLVILSACNTAAPDGTPGAPGLSGLAKAFIYAGSRALLVSHWSVVSEAAPALTTGMLGRLARDPSLGRAEALRRAMMALLDGAPTPLLAHPAAWAPFVVVGEGGAARAPVVRAARAP